MFAAAALAGAFLALALPLILAQNLLGRGAFDQIHFHEPVIRTFAAQLERGWSALDFSDYRSATTPGYHLLLALVARFVSPSGMVLQLVASLFTAAALALLAGATARQAARSGESRPALMALALALPALASMYVLFPGIWLLPDNLGWLLVLAVGLVSLRLANADRPARIRLLALGGVLLVALVLVRQSHIWAAAMLWAGAYLGADEHRTEYLFDRFSSRAPAAAAAFAATLPAFLTLAAFGWLWGGLTPPSFRAQYGGGINPATPAFILSLVALVSPFFAGFIAPAAFTLVRTRPLLLLAAAAAGLALAAIPETTFVYEARATGLWNLVKRAPVIGGHASVVLLVLAPLGAAALCAWAAALPFRARWLFLGSLAAFAAAQTASPLCWQRYIEPFLLGLFALGAASIPPAPAPAPRLLTAARLLGPLALAAALGLLTAITIIKAEVPPDTEPTPDGRRKVRELPAAPPLHSS